MERTRQEVRAEILRLVDEQSKPWRPTEMEITGGTVLGDLKIDSLDVVEITLAIEELWPELFNAIEDAFSLDSTVDQVVDIVQRKLGVLA